MKDRLPPLLEKLLDKVITYSATPVTQECQHCHISKHCSGFLGQLTSYVYVKLRMKQDTSLWYNVRRHRITASVFDTVLLRKPATSPDSLVLSILQPEQFTLPPLTVE